VRNHLRIRKFLNRPGHYAGAYVIAEVPDTASCRSVDCDHRSCFWPVLRISDCSRSIDLDFEVATAAERRNSLYKLDVLIGTLIEFRAALEIEADRAAARPRRTRKR
jgi:hypothetical protein